MGVAFAASATLRTRRSGCAGPRRRGAHRPRASPAPAARSSTRPARACRSVRVRRGIRVSRPGQQTTGANRARASGFRGGGGLGVVGQEPADRDRNRNIDRIPHRRRRRPAAGPTGRSQHPDPAPLVLLVVDRRSRPPPTPDAPARQLAADSLGATVVRHRSHRRRVGPRRQRVRSADREIPGRGRRSTAALVAVSIPTIAKSAWTRRTPRVGPWLPLRWPSRCTRIRCPGAKWPGARCLPGFAPSWPSATASPSSSGPPRSARATARALPWCSAQKPRIAIPLVMPLGVSRTSYPGDQLLSWRREFHSKFPLALEGTGPLRIGPVEKRITREVAISLRRNCDTFIPVPAVLLEYYVLSGVRPATGLNAPIHDSPDERGATDRRRPPEAGEGPGLRAPGSLLRNPSSQTIDRRFLRHRRAPGLLEGQQRRAEHLSRDPPGWSTGGLPGKASVDASGGRGRL